MYRWGNAPRRGGRGKNLLGLRRLLRRGNSEIFPPPIGLGFAAICYGRKSRAADAFRKKSLAKSCMVAGKSVPLPASLGQIFFPPPLTTSYGFARGHPPGERRTAPRSCVAIAGLFVAWYCSSISRILAILALTPAEPTILLAN